MFSLDVSEKIRPPAEEAVCLVQMLHEVVTSKVFKEAYTDMMVNGGGRWAKLGSQIEQAGQPLLLGHFQGVQPGGC